MIKINTRHLSDIFWERAFCASEIIAPAALIRLREQAIEQEGLRPSASINTGSVNLAAAWAIFCVTSIINPRVVVEVGTYIGRSTKSMALAMDLRGASNAKIYTCDASNDLEIRPDGNTSIIQFKRTGSAEMLSTLAADGVQAELMFLDGRISDIDVRLLSQMSTPTTTYLLDDFEGIEKGVCNALKLASTLSKSHHLIYPADRNLLARFGIHTRSTVGAWLPASLVSFARQ